MCSLFLAVRCVFWRLAHGVVTNVLLLMPETRCIDHPACPVKFRSLWDRHPICPGLAYTSAIVVLIDARLKLFVVLAAVFCTCLVVGDIIGGKLIEAHVFGLTIPLTVGMIPFPVTFLLTDLLNEFYGKQAARFVTWVAFAMAVLAFAFLYLALQIPIAEIARAPDWTGVTEHSFENVFGGSLRMIVASLSAYLVSQFADIGVFHLLRRATQGRMLWLRATGSTVISQGIDTITIQVVAWYGKLPISEIVALMVSSYLIKFLIAVGLTPGIYGAHALVERVLKLEPQPAEAEPT